MAEHRLMLFAMKLLPDVLEASSNEIGRGLTLSLGRILDADISKRLDSLEGGGWEIVSHNLTTMDQHLIFSFLIRR